MSGYGKDIRMAFFNAPSEARFKLIKLIEASGTNPYGKYIIAKWTTTASFPSIVHHNDREIAEQEYDKRVNHEKEIEPQFVLVAEV